MNASQRRTYSKKVERINRKLESKWFPRIRKALQQKANKVIARIKFGGSSEAFRYLSTDMLNEPLADEIRKLYTQVGLVHARRIHDDLRKEPRNLKSLFQSFQTKRLGFNAEWIRFVSDYLEKFLFDKITIEVNNTTRDALMRAIQKGVNDGLGVDDIVRVLEDWPYARFQAARIVRTEINRAANVGAMAGGSTFQFEQQKEWISAMDNRTRGTKPKDHANHRELDGNVINEDAPFVDVRNGDQLQFPGDPAASAASVINCFLPKEKIDIDLRFVKKAFRNVYKGKVVTIHTTSGNSFTCTINHPILTDRGWVKAGELTSMDYLIKSDFINNRVARIYSKVNNVPTTFEKVFSSLNKTFGAIRRLPTGMDFYGDIPAGHIDIIDTQCVLPNRDKLIFNKVVHYKVFAHANFRSGLLLSYCTLCMAVLKKFSRKFSDGFIGICDKILSFFKWSLFHSQIHRFALSSPFYTCFFESHRNGTSANPKFIGNTFYAEPIIKQGNDGINADVSSFDTTLYNSVSFKDFVDYRSATADTITDLLRRKPGFIKTDNVCDIIFHEYDGYVYTLETNNQMYDINGYVARNCRCSIALVAKRDEQGRLIPKKSLISVIQPGELPRRRTITI